MWERESVAGGATVRSAPRGQPSSALRIIPKQASVDPLDLSHPPPPPDNIHHPLFALCLPRLCAWPCSVFLTQPKPTRVRKSLVYTSKHASFPDDPTRNGSRNVCTRWRRSVLSWENPSSMSTTCSRHPHRNPSCPPTPPTHASLHAVVCHTRCERHGTNTLCLCLCLRS